MTATTGTPEQIASTVFRDFSAICGRDEATARRDRADYFAVRILGRGASGLVIHVRRTGTTDDDYALKAIDLQQLNDTDQRRAIAEVHLLLSCDFFSICRCFEDHTRRAPNNKPLFMVLIMDLGNAGDLRAEIRNRNRTHNLFREGEAGLLFLQIVLAIHHVHSRNMIHRDIKSANIFLCSNGMVKLGDFGLGKMYDNTVSANVGNTFCGTPYYVAPEIWHRQRYSKKADMFSLGVLLYELLTLERPFNGTTVEDVMGKVIAGRYNPVPKTISREMRKVVDDLLHPDPQRRPDTRDLLQRPSFKLMMDQLSHIFTTQDVFAAQRSMLLRDLDGVRANLAAPRPNPLAMPSSAGNDEGAESMSASTHSPMVCVTESGMRREAPSASARVGFELADENVFCSGALRKLSSDGSWKRRFICIYCRVPLSEATTETEFDLLVAVSKRTVRQQVMVAAVRLFADVVPTPRHHVQQSIPSADDNPDAFFFTLIGGQVPSNGGSEGVANIVFRAESAADGAIWMRKFQAAIGVDTG